MRSLGCTFSSYTPPPGHPYTMADYVCGLFRDEFDWSSLDREYLERIGAMKNGSLRPKPRRLPSVPLHAAGADCLRRDGVVEDEE